MEKINDALTGFLPHVMPEAVLGVMACVLFLAATWRPGRVFCGVVALTSIVAAALLMARGATVTDAVLYNAPVVPGPLSLFFKGLALATGFVLVLLGWDEGGDEHPGEYHACLLLITAGASLTGCANDLITLFLALELISIPTYVLLYLPRSTRHTQEAAMKYFLLSVFSSGLLLFGFSYLYGVTGTTNIPAIIDAIAPGREVLAKAPVRGLILISLVMVVAGLGFRVTAMPFHYYAPDVYQGTTTPSAALLSVVPKIAGFAALIRVLGFMPAESGGNPAALGEDVPSLLWMMAAATMTVGNILALWQDNIRRLLAYSSVANAGYMLIGLAAVPGLAQPGAEPPLVGGVEALLFYLAAYAAMTVGAFAVLHLLSCNGREVETVDDLAGVGKTHPRLALVMVLFLLSMIGIPLTAGFLGKFQLFSLTMSLATGVGQVSQPDAGIRQALAYQAQRYGLLALIAALNAAIGAWYYLRLAVAMYLREGVEPLPAMKPAPALAAVALCAALTVGLGVWPTPVMEALRGAMSPTATAARAAQPAGPRLAGF